MDYDSSLLKLKTHWIPIAVIDQNNNFQMLRYNNFEKTLPNITLLHIHTVIILLGKIANENLE